jgi:hypothetical protein
VVDGWHTEEADDLHDAVAAKLATLEEPAPGVAPLPGAPGAPPQPPPQPQPPPAAPPARPDGSDWEIDTSKLQFLEKVASGSFGDLFRGMYNGQEVAIKVLRLAHHNDQAHLIREFMQELAGTWRGRSTTPVRVGRPARKHAPRPAPCTRHGAETHSTPTPRAYSAA